MYLKPFHKWSRDRSLFKLEQERYIAPSKPIKPTHKQSWKMPNKGYLLIIFVNGVRQR